MTYPETVETERLLLRRLRPGDHEAMSTTWSDPDVWRALRPGARFDAGFVAARARHHAEHWREHGFGLWIAESRDGGEIAGWIGASHPDRVPELSEAVEIGWTLRRRFWGRGLASEGARAAVRAAFDHLGVEEVISLIHPANRRSSAVAARLGMRHVRDARHSDVGKLQVYAVGRHGPPAPL